ncbi:MAG TPA: small ribosomal subunit Rsm22 family protein [Labilithrix sp.]|nr:small ribosomal subunit Rsm22 family protein [Labilithrix sp.]
MNPHALVRPLEASWQDVLDAVLRSVTRPSLSTRDVAKLAPKVEELSRAYNAGQAEGRRTKLPLEARVAFSFPRDVPKGAAAVRELVASGALTMPAGRPLRVLDLGAGLGAMTWGLVRALVAGGATGRVEALLVDEDGEVLRTAEALARQARATLGPLPIDLAATTRVQSLDAYGSRGDSEGRANHTRYDIVLLGQVLSEIDPRSLPMDRVETQAALIARLLDTVLAPDGALVIVEPALRERTRHLHFVRDRLLANESVSAFAPCLHRATCPMLAIDTEWCHEDLAVDLPSWVAPLARAAGLRWQGLTFSYLVLRKDGRVPVPRIAPGTGVRFRAVSDVLRTKGKGELFVCGEDGARRRVRRLDRDEGFGSGVSLFELRRGDIVTLRAGTSIASGESGSTAAASAAPVAPPIDDRGRVARDVHVAIDVGSSRK